jgi:lipopolysaccharide/colanic/teichoic acid biosynthesis glycosyltransferase
MRFTSLGVVAETPAAIPLDLRESVIGFVDDLPAFLEELRPDRIVVALDEARCFLPIRSLLDAKIRGISVESGQEFYERLSGKIAIESLAACELILAPEFRWPRGELAIGRVLNFVFAIAALALFAPIFALIALAIRIESGEPVLFVQNRVGLQGRVFQLFKFRTMRPATGPRSEWVRDNDDRITRVGRWLRKFRLDELPQLVNVARGDMSLVGPRPHPASNFEILSTVARNVPDSGTSIPYYAMRSSVRPGITGWAQIRYGYANDVVQEMEKLKFDLYYIKHRSLWLDLRILAETLHVIVAGRESVEVRAPLPPRQPSAQSKPRGQGWTIPLRMAKRTKPAVS